jgi:NTP pyrophosphatase (non-canonical NTP hydrolase)
MTQDEFKIDIMADGTRLGQPQKPDYVVAVNSLFSDIHAANVKAGWWTNPHTGESILETRNVGEILMLIVSEVAEAMEGHRKGLQDDKLPHRSMLEVELADVIIRIGDLACAKGLDVGGAIKEKLAYNANRADHKLENRVKPGGKAY